MLVSQCGVFMALTSRRGFGLFVAGLIAMIGFLWSAADAVAQKGQAATHRELARGSYAPIVKRTAPAVVNVFVRGRVQVRSPLFDDPFFRQFFGDQLGMPTERTQSSLGSGVIVSPEGVVVTNTHVIKIGGQAEIRVVLADKREFDAKVILQDEKTDITVLRLEGGDGKFPFLEFENSDDLEVGDQVLAIGNPFGVGQTVTRGIVSALARTEISKSDAQAFIQTDAAINPGNSGGALVDMDGRLVGINTAIYTRSGGSQGIGFAIPSNLVKIYVESALAGRKVERPWLGAQLDPVTRDIADALKLDRAIGVLVKRVHAASPAAEARLEPGDVIVAVDGQEVSDPRAVQYRLTTRGLGNTARLDVMRQGRRMVVDVALRAAPRPTKGDVKNLAGQHPLDGARVVNLYPPLADELGLDETEGVVIVEVRSGSIADRLGFKAGDVIATVGEQQIDSVETLEPLLKTRRRLWQMAVKRGGRLLQLQVPG
ncbi:MAG: Do family serine endopeptidase [Proteobacteria bacterium]|nr:Do family serine endopeptidase [Pseudomonadota bacterium]